MYDQNIKGLKISSKSKTDIRVSGRKSRKKNNDLQKTMQKIKA